MTHAGSRASDQDAFTAAYSFEDVVRRTLPGWSKPFPAVRCPDRYVGLMRDLGEGVDFPMRLSTTCRPDTACLLLILESPHIGEYQRPDAPEPAKGHTGTMIRAHLPELIQAKDDMGLVLINAVPYQCSLAGLHRTRKPVETRYQRERRRDAIFLACWSAGARAEFLVRLRHAYRSGDLVLNCCTRGKTKRNGGYLRDAVQAAIIEVVDQGVHCRTHPSGWKGAIGAEWKSA